ncbi:MAG: cytochrome c [Myxococcaceae bacterium]|nr:cytochrome c [Myxococcaceae bacterium]
MPQAVLARTLTLVLVTALLSACQDGDDGGSSGTDASGPAIQRAAGAVLYANRCAACHGSEGRGDGTAGKGLTPSPRNFRDPAWQAQVTDQRIETVIRYGGAAAGLSPVMPPGPDLGAKDIRALRAYIRSLGQQSAAR